MGYSTYNIQKSTGKLWYVYHNVFRGFGNYLGKIKDVEKYLQEWKEKKAEIIEIGGWIIIHPPNPPHPPVREG